MGKVLERAKELEERNAALETQRADLDGQVEEISEKRLALLDLAEKVLIENVQHVPRDPWPWVRHVKNHFPEKILHVFDELGWDAERIGKEAGRISGVLRWRPVAGNPAEREETKRQLAAAESELSERAPKIEQAIAKLQRELSGLQRDVRDSANKVAEQEQALGFLRDFIPPHVERQHEAALARMGDMRVKVTEAHAAVARTKSILAIDISRGVGLAEEEKIRLLGKTVCPEAIGPTKISYHDGRGKQVGIVDHADKRVENKVPDEYHWSYDFGGKLNIGKFREFQDSLRAKLPELEQRAADVQQSLDNAIAEANQLLDIYGG